MKRLVAAIMSFLFSSGAFALAAPSVSANPPVQKVVQTYNQFYPTLNLSVHKSVSDDVLYEQLEMLGDALNGESVDSGLLMNLACCHRSCGGSGCAAK
jgi:hypothetical protein